MIKIKPVSAKVVFTNFDKITEYLFVDEKINCIAIIDKFETLIKDLKKPILNFQNMIWLIFVYAYSGEKAFFLTIKQKEHKD